MGVAPSLLAPEQWALAREAAMAVFDPKTEHGDAVYSCMMESSNVCGSP